MRFHPVVVSCLLLGLAPACKKAAPAPPPPPKVTPLDAGIRPVVTLDVPVVQDVARIARLRRDGGARHSMRHHTHRDGGVDVDATVAVSPLGPAIPRAEHIALDQIPDDAGLNSVISTVGTFETEEAAAKRFMLSDAPDSGPEAPVHMDLDGDGTLDWYFNSGDECVTVRHTDKGWLAEQLGEYGSSGAQCDQLVTVDGKPLLFASSNGHDVVDDDPSEPTYSTDVTYYVAAFYRPNQPATLALSAQSEIVRGGNELWAFHALGNNALVATTSGGSNPGTYVYVWDPSQHQFVQQSCVLKQPPEKLSPEPRCVAQSSAAFHLREREQVESIGVNFAAGTEVSVLYPTATVRGAEKMFCVETPNHSFGFMFLSEADFKQCPTRP